MARQTSGVLEAATKSSGATRKPKPAPKAQIKAQPKAKTTPRRRAKPAGERVLLEPLPPMLPATQAEPKPVTKAEPAPEATGRNHPVAHHPTEDAIRERAYQLYVERGSQPGRDVEDWTQAEQELRHNRAA